MKSLIELRNVAFSYDGMPVLIDVDLSLREGEKVGLIGTMGAGKTTLLHIAVGLLKPQRGTVYAFGSERKLERDFLDVRRRAGLVFQDSDDQLFCPTVLEDVAFGPLNLGHSVETAKEAASRALRRVGLDGFEKRITYRLSGGEKRLVALATVLAMEPEILLLDEPQNGLDLTSYQRVRDLLVELPQSMIIVSHDSDFLQRVTTKCLYLQDGRINSEPSA
jgi:cobalt/nickel transport system ATP-binding protein